MLRNPYSFSHWERARMREKKRNALTLSLSLRARE